MSISINATLLVQGANFLIAYILLRVLLFSPAIDQIKKEQDLRTGLLEALAGLEKIANERKDQHKNSEQRLHSYFHDNAPRITHLGTPLVTNLTPAITLAARPNPDQAIVASLRHLITTTLEQP